MAEATVGETLHPVTTGIINTQVHLRPLKEVIFRTPVIIGSTDLQQHYAAEKVRYRKGDLLHDVTVPEVCQHLPYGMVIDIPVTSIEEYMHQFLSWLPIKSDEELLLLLHGILHESR